MAESSGAEVAPFGDEQADVEAAYAAAHSNLRSPRWWLLLPLRALVVGALTEAGSLVIGNGAFELERVAGIALLAAVGYVAINAFDASIDPRGNRRPKNP